MCQMCKIRILNIARVSLSICVSAVKRSLNQRQKPLNRTLQVRSSFIPGRKMTIACQPLLEGSASFISCDTVHLSLRLDFASHRLWSLLMARGLRWTSACLPKMSRQSRPCSEKLVGFVRVCDCELRIPELPRASTCCQNQVSFDVLVLASSLVLV